MELLEEVAGQYSHHAGGDQQGLRGGGAEDEDEPESYADFFSL